MSHCVDLSGWVRGVLIPPFLGAGFGFYSDMLLNPLLRQLNNKITEAEVEAAGEAMPATYDQVATSGAPEESSTNEPTANSVITSVSAEIVPSAAEAAPSTPQPAVARRISSRLLIPVIGQQYEANDVRRKVDSFQVPIIGFRFKRHLFFSLLVCLGWHGFALVFASWIFRIVKDQYNEGGFKAMLSGANIIGCSTLGLLCYPYWSVSSALNTVFTHCPDLIPLSRVVISLNGIVKQMCVYVTLICYISVWPYIPLGLYIFAVSFLLSPVVVCAAGVYGGLLFILSSIIQTVNSIPFFGPPVVRLVTYFGGFGLFNSFVYFVVYKFFGHPYPSSICLTNLELIVVLVCIFGMPAVSALLAFMVEDSRPVVAGTAVATAVATVAQTDVEMAQIPEG